MKDDLIKVLNFKLKHITDNIDELNVLNSKIDEENEKLQYIQNAINNFKGEERGFDIYKFSKLDRESFNKLLMELSDDVLAKFGTSSCNYDGLIYLINGINNGISLTLTQEQIDAINLLIDKLLEKEKEYREQIADLNVEKQKLDIKDIDALVGLQNKYSTIIDEFEDKKYVTEIDEIIDAINYSELSEAKTFDLLCFLLKYNSGIYEEAKDRVVLAPANENTIDLTVPFEEVQVEEEKTESVELSTPIVELPQEIVVQVEENEESLKEEEEVQEEPKGPSVEERLSDASYNDEIDLEKTMNLPDFSYLKREPLKEEIEVPVVHKVIEESKNYKYEPKEEKVVSAVSIEEDNNDELVTITPEVDEDFNDLSDEDFEDYNPVLPSLEEVPTVDLSNVVSEVVNTVTPSVEVQVPTPMETMVVFDKPTTPPLAPVEAVQPINVEPVTPPVVETKVETPVVVQPIPETPMVVENSVKLNEEDVRKVFDEYGIKYDSIDDVTKTLLLKGDLDNYKSILAKLKELNVLSIFHNNIETLVQIVLYSSVQIIDEIINIIGTSLSVDEDDKKITTNIVFKTIPSVFVKNENGNYDNFMKNLQSFKDYGIDLINLFDFSKEVYVADHDYLVNNYNTVRTYDLTVNDRNAKYFLLLPNISSRLDYYVESVYRDTMKGSHGDIFDGMDLIKLYPSKLNIVTDETIKRLRYSSENGKKIFGSKEKSLSGEITNLKVDVLNIPDDYLRTFFNNEFDIITRGEVDQYEKLVMNNDYVAPSIDDMLNKLETLRQGMRYVIEGINVSRNKVIRNYNILVKNNVEKTKALLFAICHNLVVTKAEYEKIKTFVNGLGGN